jgi:uncharacterized protein (DUF302 family)
VRNSAGIEAQIGHPDMIAFRRKLSSAATHRELEELVESSAGTSGLMEFARYDLGGVLQKEQGIQAHRSLRFVIGNPVIMKELVKRVPDAGSYAPVTVLVDERFDGNYLSNDRMASFLASYRNPDALKVAQDLDAKVQAMLTQAA